jgi:cell fate regulator YaaT (PSP1 superfamily)
MCGRLLCCLAYENNQYIEIKQAMPKVGTLVATQQGKGTIVSLNVLTETVTVELQSELTVEFKPDEVTTLAEQKRPVKARGRGTP